MELEDIIKGLALIQEPPRFPREEIEAAVEIEEKIIPFLLKELEVTSQNKDLLEQGFEEGSIKVEMFMLLLAKFKCHEAFPLILKIMSFNEELVEDYFESFLTEGLSNVLLSTYNDDYESLISFILNSKNNEWARYAALWCLTGLVIHGIEPRDKVVKTLIGLLDEISYENDFTVFQGALGNSIDIYPEGELLVKIRCCIDNLELDEVREYSINLQDVLDNDIISHYRQIKNNVSLRYVNDVEDLIGWWGCFHEDPEEKEAIESFLDRVYEMPSGPRPIVNDVKVGRNDPCPCGSGKKYKKCCGK